MRVASKTWAWGAACAVLLVLAVWLGVGAFTHRDEVESDPAESAQPGHPPEEKARPFIVTKAPEGEEDSLEVVEAQLTGRIIDHDGAPVSGARIAPQLPPGTSRVSELLHGVKARAGMGISDREGQFAVTVFPAGYEYKVRVLAQGFVPLELTIRIPREGLKGVEFVIHRASSVEGVIVDQAGKPLPRMVVTALDVDTGLPCSEATPTGHDGLFRIPALLPNDYALTARYVPARWGGMKRRGVQFGDLQRPLMQLELGDGEKRAGVRLEVVWDAKTGISGAVVDVHGAPVAGARVWAESPRYAERTLGVSPTPTDEFGRFHIDAVTLGFSNLGADVAAVDVCCERTGYEPGCVKNVPVGTEDLKVQVRGLQRGTVTGTVLDKVTRTPVTTARVVLAQSDCEWGERWNPDWQQFLSSVRAGVGGVDASGRFTIPDVRAGRAALLVYAADYGVAREGGIVVQAGQTADVEILLEGPGVLAVTVKYQGVMEGQAAEFSLDCWPAGQPMAMPHFNEALLTGMRTGRSESVSPQEAGTHELELPPGEYDVVAKSRFFREGEIAVPASQQYTIARAVISSGQVTPLEIAVGEGGTVRGDLTLREGEQRLYLYLVPGDKGLTLQDLAKPHQLAPAWGGLQYLATSGPFIMNCVPQGTHTLTVFARCPDETLYVRGSETFSIQNGGLVTIDIP